MHSMIIKLRRVSTGGIYECPLLGNSMPAMTCSTPALKGQPTHGQKLSVWGSPSLGSPITKIYQICPTLEIAINSPDFNVGRK